MGFLLSLYEICEDIKIHALSNIMPIKGGHYERKLKILYDYKLKKKFFLILYSKIFQIYAKHTSNFLSNCGKYFWGLALKKGIPAAPLAGALIGASILNISGKVDIAKWPIRTRTILEIGIRTVIGTSLTKDSLMDLQTLRRPAILITFTLVITGLAILL